MFLHLFLLYYQDDGCPASFRNTVRQRLDEYFSNQCSQVWTNIMAGMKPRLDSYRLLLLGSFEGYSIWRFTCASRTRIQSANNRSIKRDKGNIKRAVKSNLRERLRICLKKGIPYWATFANKSQNMIWITVLIYFSK